MLDKIKFPYKVGKRGALVGESGEGKAVGFEIEFYYEEVSLAFTLWARKYLGEEIIDLEDFTEYLSKLQDHPLFLKVYTDTNYMGSQPNVEFVTEPMTLEVMYGIIPFMKHFFLQLKVFQFLCLPYSNVDLNFDLDFFEPSDWLNLFRFFIKNPTFLVYYSGRQQISQNKADFRSMYQSKYQFLGGFMAKRKMAKEMHNFARALENKDGFESFGNVYLRPTHIEIKWFGNPFDYEKIVSYVEMIISIVNFKRNDKSFRVEDYYIYLDSNCIKYSYFYQQVSRNAFGYLNLPGSNDKL